jgi:glutamine transport system ATP-binding protein
MRRHEQAQGQVDLSQYEGPYAELRDVSVSAGRNELVHGITLAVMSGEVLRIGGPNGSGKSTVLRTLELIEPVGTSEVTGDVMLFGRNMGEASKKERQRIKRAHVGMGFQKLNLPGALTAHEHLTGLNHRLHLPVDQNRLEGVVELLGIKDKLMSPIGTLSGGEKQRVDLARTALKWPNLWILDEPTSAVDSEGKGIIYKAIRHFCSEEGAAAVLVSHDEEAVTGYIDRTVMLHDGHVVDTDVI